MSQSLQFVGTVHNTCKQNECTVYKVQHATSRMHMSSSLMNIYARER